ncbi:hypothetical protein KC573_03210 [candidate division WWE3 bacterium]|uniref:Uncharacterized protein n=1 Tax=candidate division WWE3 bacterium TaxID=2053526 RepID=A0A955LX45_UNCKA|nr:hypothetical protein [candidate division WWE3 bacterium]
MFTSLIAFLIGIHAIFVLGIIAEWFGDRRKFEIWGGRATVVTAMLVTWYGLTYAPLPKVADLTITTLIFIYFCVGVYFYSAEAVRREQYIKWQNHPQVFHNGVINVVIGDLGALEITLEPMQKYSGNALMALVLPDGSILNERSSNDQGFETWRFVFTVPQGQTVWPDGRYVLNVIVGTTCIRRQFNITRHRITDRRGNLFMPI